MTSAFPTAIDRAAGTHALCTCGQSQTGPFCDGSHQGSASRPEILSLNEAKTIHLCRCGGTATLPFCDGSHQNLGATAGS